MARLSVVAESPHGEDHLAMPFRGVQFGEVEDLVRNLERENAELRERIDTASAFTSRSSIISSSMSSRLSVSAAAWENEEVLARNKELHDLVRDLRRQQSVAQQQLESLEEATQEHADKVKTLEAEKKELQLTNSELQNVCTLVPHENNSPSHKIRTSNPSNVLWQTADLQQEVFMLKNQSEESRCELDALRFQAHQECEVVVHERRELDEERQELRLLLEAKHGEVSMASIELESLRDQLIIAKSLGHSKALSVKPSSGFSSNASCRSSSGNLQRRRSSGNLERQMTQAEISDEERDGETVSEPTEVEDCVSDAEQQPEIAHATKPHTNSLQGSCDWLQRPQLAKSSSPTEVGSVNAPVPPPPKVPRAQTFDSISWEGFMGAFSCCARHSQERRRSGQ